MNHQDLLRFLKATDIFKGLSDPDLQLLIPFIRLKQFERGDWILKEGETGEELFFIKEGEAEVLKGENHKQQPLRLAILKPGDWRVYVAGETAGSTPLFDGAPCAGRARVAARGVVVLAR